MYRIKSHQHPNTSYYCYVFGRHGADGFCQSDNRERLLDDETVTRGPTPTRSTRDVMTSCDDTEWPCFFFPKTFTRLYGATVEVSEMKKTRSVFGTRLPLRSGFTLTLLMVFILKETKNHKCTEAVAIRFHVGSTALYIDGSNSSLIDIKYLKTLDISCLQGWVFLLG